MDEWSWKKAEAYDFFCQTWTVPALLHLHHFAMNTMSLTHQILTLGMKS